MQVGWIVPGRERIAARRGPKTGREPKTAFIVMIIPFLPLVRAGVFGAVALAFSLFFVPGGRAQSDPGNSLYVAGTINYVSVPHTAAFNSLPITVMAWVRTSVTSGQQGLVNKYVANSFNGWNLFLLNGRVRAWYFVSSTRNVYGGGDGLDGGFIADGNWHHLALVVDSSGATIYVDGINRASRLWTGAFGAATTSQEMRMGSYPGGNLGFVGSIFLDDVSVWNAALNPSQIANSRSGFATGLEGSRLAYYRCDEPDGSLTVGDSAALGGINNGTWNGLSLFSRVYPSVQTSAASGVGATEAFLNGIVNPNRATVTAGFQWGATTNYGEVLSLGTMGGAGFTGGLGLSRAVTGLTPGREYHYRAYVSNSVGIQFGGDQSFRALGPFATTLPASSVTVSSAVINGAANPRGTSANAWFEFGTTTNYDGVTTPQAVGSGNIDVGFSAVLSALPFGTTFHYRAVASNSFGVTYGVDQNFKTLGPGVESLAASGVTQTLATLNGLASPAGATATVWFEWGFTTDYGNETPPRPVTGGLPVPFAETVSNLIPGGTFHYRAVLAAGASRVTGTNQTFTTPAEPGLMVLPGGVAVVVQPAEAVAEGARWSLDNGPEMFPGYTNGLVAPGRHTLRFRNLPNWSAPAPTDLYVVGGKTSVVSVAFTPIQTFALGTVPDQHARAGQTLEFFVNGVPSGGVLQVAAVPPPAGSFTFDPATGRVRYVPAPGDHLPFTLNFSVNGALTATTVITPLQTLPPEDVVLQYDRPMPDEESRDYITINETPSAAMELFNSVSNQVFTVDISGKTLVFEATHPAHLHRVYNGRDNLKELRLYADKVIIRSPLLLPQTHVTIRARELRFEGNGSIDTTPLARWLKPDQISPLAWSSNDFTAAPGHPGHDGGNADVYVERFYADPSPAARFILQGGAGGEPGEGRNGYDEGVGFPDPATGGTTMLPFFFGDGNWFRLMARAGNETNCGFYQNACVQYHEDHLQFNTGPITTNNICGVRGAVARGEPAVPSGVPGKGGRGGVLRSTLDLRSYASLTGGMPGAPSPTNYLGGTLFFQYSHTYTLIRSGNNPRIVTDRQPAPRERGTAGIAPTGSTGAPGSFELVRDPSSWLHSFGLRAITRFAKDAYLNGRVAETRTMLSEYRDLLQVLQPEVGSVTNLSEAEFAETTSLDQVSQEMGSVVDRIDMNLDFFGNPAGWVPMLSFEANLTAFQDEVNRSIPILYLTYWLNYSATNLQNSANAAGETLRRLREEYAEMVKAYNQVQTTLPGLKTRSAEIQIRINQLHAELQSLEQQLVARAQANVEERHKVPFWKKAIGVLAVAADLVPVGQPTIGRIGEGLKLLTQVDPEHPVQSALRITNVFGVLSNKDVSICFSGSVTNGTNQPGGTNTVNRAKRKEQLKQLSNCGKFLKAEFKELASIFKEVQVDDKELQAEIEKVKASDPVFKKLTEDLAVLNQDKERFAAELASALQAIATLASDMTENQLAVDEMEVRVANQFALLDHNALMHIKEMERRAKDRLLKFQYFAAQAFQYRMLQGFPGNFNLNTLFTRFQDLVAGPNGHLLTQQEFENLKQLFQADLANTVNSVMASLNANAPLRETPRTFDLTPEELRTLNATNLVINLAQRTPRLFPSTREDIRIVNLRVSAIRAHPVGGSLGGDAVMFIDFNHLGESRITRNGQNFRFRHYQSATVSPIAWSTDFDPVHHTTNSSVLSTSSQSLLRALLSQPSDANMLLFSRPAADADLLIRREVLSDNGIDLALDQLSITVEYEYANQPTGFRTLDVTVTDDLQPVIALNQPDVSGRRDGQGDFRRVYPAGIPLTLNAPATYGGRAFDRWVINGIERPAAASAVTFTITEGTSAEARYQALSGSGAPPSITSPPANTVAVLGTTATFNVTASGGGTLTFRWRKNGVPLSDGGRVSGAATAALTLSNVQASDAAAYSVVVSNAVSSVTSASATLTVAAPNLAPVPAAPGNVGFRFATVSGRRYIVERKFSLADPVWTPVQTNAGTGGPLTFTRPTSASASSFFRLRAE